LKILIFGGSGMLGHQLLLAYQGKYDVKVTLRNKLSFYAGIKVFNKNNTFPSIDLNDKQLVEKLLLEVKPDVVINAVGIIKQDNLSKSIISSIEMNALFPHQLAEYCKAINTKMIHLSTDCIFSGKKGFYNEADYPDSEDTYGRTKLLGEVSDSHCITLRTSIIGLELYRKRSLIEWFLSQKGYVKGFNRAIYNGFTTKEMARIIEMVMFNWPNLSGVWHVSSEPISKFYLLSKLAERIYYPNEIVVDETFQCDRSLDGSRFRQATGYIPPSWDKMLGELALQIKQRGA